MSSIYAGSNPDPVPVARWVRVDRLDRAARITRFSQCGFCAHHLEYDAHYAHELAACLLCGTQQCVVPRSHQTCAVCLYGWLRPKSPRICGYTWCWEPSVANAPRVGQCCLACADRCPVQTKPRVTMTQAVKVYLTRRGTPEEPGPSWRFVTWAEATS